MKARHTNTEYMCGNERDPSGAGRFQEVEMIKVEDFKYLGSTPQGSSVVKM